MITGATSGIGLQTALQLARMGADIFFTARDMAKAEKVRNQIIAENPSAFVKAYYCRMDSMKSISEFCGIFSAENSELHVLINNAGIWETSRKESEDGIELTFAVNHLAPFLLTNLLFHLLRSSAPSRIVTVASESHRNTPILFDDIEHQESYPTMRAYSQSKLANVLFTRSLAQRLNSAGITANCVHPGVVLTPIFDKLHPFLKFFLRIIMISSVKGARGSVYLASSGDVAQISGAYFKKCKRSPGSAHSNDMRMADKLWELSVDYTKTYFKQENFKL